MKEEKIIFRPAIEQLKLEKKKQITQWSIAVIIGSVAFLFLMLKLEFFPVWFLIILICFYYILFSIPMGYLVNEYRIFKSDIKNNYIQVQNDKIQNHINNPVMRCKIKTVLEKAGYKSPELCSPEEFVGENYE